MPLLPVFLLGLLIGYWIADYFKQPEIEVRKIDGFEFCRMHGIPTRVIDAKYEELKK